MIGHKFYSTDSQYERMTTLANECGLTFSQFIQKIADFLEDRENEASLIKLLKLKDDCMKLIKLQERRKHRDKYYDDFWEENELFWAREIEKEREKEKEKDPDYLYDDGPAAYH